MEWKDAVQNEIRLKLFIHIEEVLGLFLYYSKRWSGVSVIGIVMRPWAGQPRGCVSVCGTGSLLFSSPELPGRLWNPSYLLLNMYRLFFVGKRPGMKLITELRLMSRLTTSRTTTPLPHVFIPFTRTPLFLPCFHDATVYVVASVLIG